MTKPAFDMDFEDLPGTLPIFPLYGVLLLPRGQLPLNIFEPRYLAMVDDALRGSRLIGMVQPRSEDAEDTYDIGCAGRISQFEETDDGRYEIKLTGLCRFKVLKEEKQHESGFRQVTPAWGAFAEDMIPPSCLNLDREKLMDLLSHYFSQEEMTCAAEKLQGAPDERLMTCLSMICPFDPKDKQALLEAPCCQTRAEAFMAMLEIAVKGGAKLQMAHH